MKLYQHPMSSNVRRVRMVAIALGIPLDLELIDIAKGAGQSPEYLALNPNGKVPTLVDGDTILWESQAIAMYLADKKPGNKLYPTDLAARAAVNKWLFWGASHFGSAAATLLNQNFIKPMMGKGNPDPGIVAFAEAEFTRCCKVLDAHLSKQPFLCGDAISLADYSVVAPLMYVGPGKLPLEGHANVTAWFARMQETEAWKQTQPQM